MLPISENQDPNLHPRDQEQFNPLGSQHSTPGPSTPQLSSVDYSSSLSLPDGRMIVQGQLLDFYQEASPANTHHIYSTPTYCPGNGSNGQGTAQNRPLNPTMLPLGYHLYNTQSNLFPAAIAPMSTYPSSDVLMTPQEGNNPMSHLLQKHYPHYAQLPGSIPPMTYTSPVLPSGKQITSDYNHLPSPSQVSATNFSTYNSILLQNQRHDSHVMQNNTIASTVYSSPQPSTDQSWYPHGYLTSTHLNNMDSSTMPSSTPPNQTTNYWAPHNQIVGNYNDTTINNFKADPLQLLWQEIANVGATHSSEARYPPPKCHADTRKEILQQLTSQIHGHAGPGVYWLSGPAGAGKSAIAQTISEDCEKSGKLAASFFFSRNQPKRSIPTYLFLSIAYGLASSVPKLQHFIGSVIQSNPAILHSSLEVQFTRLIADPCRWLHKQGLGWGDYSGLVVIDGLDECNGGESQTRVLSIIAGALKDQAGLPLQFLICSRPEPSIKEFFDSSIFQPHLTCYFLHNDSSTRRDIVTFLHDGFQGISSKTRYQDIQFPDPWPTLNTIEILAQKSCGQFIYPSTILKYVDDEFSDPRKRLNIILGLSPTPSDTSPFRELDLLYHHILSVNPNYKTVLDILGTLISWKLLNPENGRFNLSLPQVELLLGLQDGEAALALRGIHSVLQIEKTTKEVNILHASFSDFLTSKSRSMDFLIDLDKYKHSTIVCATRFVKGQLPSYSNYPEFASPEVRGSATIATPPQHQIWLDYMIWSRWSKWFQSETISQPPQSILSALTSVPVIKMYDAALQELIQSSKNNHKAPGWRWMCLIKSCHDILLWLKSKTLLLCSQSLILQFERFTQIWEHGFHVSLRKEQLPVLEAAMTLLLVKQPWNVPARRLPQDILPCFKKTEDIIQNAQGGIRIVDFDLKHCSICFSTPARSLSTHQCTSEVHFFSMQTSIFKPVFTALSDIACDTTRRHYRDSACYCMSYENYPTLSQTFLVSLLEMIDPNPSSLSLFRNVISYISSLKGEEHQFYAAVITTRWLKSFKKEYSSQTKPLIASLGDPVRHLSYERAWSIRSAVEARTYKSPVAMGGWQDVTDTGSLDDVWKNRG